MPSSTSHKGFLFHFLLSDQTRGDGFLWGSFQFFSSLAPNLIINNLLQESWWYPNCSGMCAVRTLSCGAAGVKQEVRVVLEGHNCKVIGLLPHICSALHQKGLKNKQATDFNYKIIKSVEEILMLPAS